jgi:tRNA G18 (ribose-2'-O)-methylase SpoU
VPLLAFDDAPESGSRSSRQGDRRCTSSTLSGPVTFVLGAERQGCPRTSWSSHTKSRRSRRSGAAESLNVAVAGAIALYERSRRS